MTSRSSYTPITQSNDEDLNSPPPPTPRRERDSWTKTQKFGAAVIVGWLISMLLVRMWAGSFKFQMFPDWFLTVLVCEVAVILFMLVPEVYRAEERGLELFAKGIAASATVTFVGIIRHPKDNAFCLGVRWTFIADDVLVTCVSPRAQLPNAVVGDRFWILYEEEHPWYARRWGLFDKNGSMTGNDKLVWKYEKDVNFEYYCSTAGK